jgi:Ca2+-binding RTX toxin-like protein
MAVFSGSSFSEEITPFFVSESVIRIPSGAFPGDLADEIDAGGGNDTVDGGGGSDFVWGGDGNDRIDGGGGDDWIDGGAGRDTIRGGTGTDSVWGGAGNDVIYSSGYGEYDGGSGNDVLYAANGLPEELRGGAGIDTLNTTSGDFDYEVNLSTGLTNFDEELYVEFERLITGTGNDTLIGTAGRNFLSSGAGDDELTGGLGADILSGGAGYDVFAFADDESAPGARDRVQGFEFGLVGSGDKIDLSLISGVLDFGANLWTEDSLTGFDTIIYGDADEDGAVDFELAVADGEFWTAADWSDVDFL